MFRNRFILSMVVLSVVLVSVTIYYPRTSASPAIGHGANDFYQRHPAWAIHVQNAGIPITGSLESPDYYQRHPEMRVSIGIAVDVTDYFARHPELRTPATIDLSDYFLRH